MTYFEMNFPRLMCFDTTKLFSYPKLNGYGDNDATNNVVFLRFRVLYLFNTVRYLHTAQVRPLSDTQAKPCRGECAL